MIEHTNLISDDDGYKSFNHFEISETLKDILYDDYFNYKTQLFDKTKLTEELYHTNFVNKYDPVEHKQIFDVYINKDSFRQKAYFVYSIIDYKRYETFVNENKEIENPNDMTITYSVLDSLGVKVQIYKVSIADIAFLF